MNTEFGLQHKRRRVSACILALLLVLCTVSLAAASDSAMRLTAQSFAANRYALQFDRAWLYHAGDDSAWRDPGYDDSAWPLRRAWFRPEQAEPDEYSTIGWFRQHLSIDSSLSDRPVYMKLSSVGAVEVFLDGERIYALGKVSADAASERAVCGRWSEPLRLPMQLGRDHVLAVRFSNHQIDRLKSAGTVAGFQPELTLGNAPDATDGFRPDILLVSWSLIAGLCLAQLVLHLKIYLNYRAARENLTFAVFTGAISFLAVHLVVMMSTPVTTISRLLVDAALLRALVMLIALTGLHFVHEVGTSWNWIRSPRVWIMIALGSAVAYVLSTQAVYVLAMLLMVEMIRTLVAAVRARVEKVWIVTVGFGAFIVAVAAESLMVLGVTEYRPALDLLPIGGLAILAISMSAYLGVKFAGMNHSLVETVEHSRKAVRALLESEARYRAMVENTVAGVGIVDDRNRVIFANDRYAEILAMRKEDLIGQDGFEPIAPEHLEGVTEKIGQIIRGETQQVTHEFDILCADGKRRTVYCSASTYTTREGHKNLVVHSTDVTEQREAERKQREAITLAERTARMASIGVMAGGITHEINQPLNAIMLHAETLQYMARSGKLDQMDSVQTALKHIVMSTERISEIIQHMRSFWISTPEATDLTVVDMNAPVRQALQLTEQKIRAHAIHVTLALCEEPLPVKADALQLEQIVINLLTNAINALDKLPKRDKQILVRTYRDGEDAGLEIADNGPGLGTTDADKLYDPFFSTGKDKGGTGLGLAIVRMFVERFKGKTGGRNNDSGGATFSVRLPLSIEVEQTHANTVS